VNPDSRKEIIDFCNSRNQIIDKLSIELLEEKENWKEILENLDEPIISAEKVREKLTMHTSKLSQMEDKVEIKKTKFAPKAKETDADFYIMDEYEITNKSCSEGKMDDFQNYFRDKYDFLSSLLSKRAGFSPLSQERFKRAEQYAEVDIVGMVVKKWVSKKGNKIFELDNFEGKMLVIVSQDDHKMNMEADKILIDDVIGIKGKKFTDEMIIMQSYLRPDLEQRPAKKAKRDLSVMLISDTHVGSKLFLEKEFKKFISWLNGNSVSESEKDRIGKIKYLVVAGDNVDGIGIYPNQIDELGIKDIYQQYDKFAECIKEVPEHIEVFICPGQHDAVRRADPQPAIPREYVKELYDLKNIHFVGSPSWVEMEGIKCMIYHGASHHDMYAATKHLDVKKPELGMIELLKRRDISTGFGQFQPYVPEKKDYMLIREEPDIYFGGDMHHKGYATYRGCLAVNAGTWQEQTDFQIKEGHKPTPGIAIDINLKTRQLTENNFYSKEGL